MNRRICIPVLAVAALAGALDAAAQGDKEFITLELGARAFFGELDGRLRSAPGVSHVRIDEDLDSGADATGMGISLTGHLRGNTSFNIQAWQLESEGESTISEGQSWGDLVLTPGGSVDTDVDVRYVSTKIIFGVTPEREALRFGLGIGGKVIDWKTELILDTGERDQQKMRMIYPTGEIEASYLIGEAVTLKAEAGLGMPAFAKKSMEIQSPYELRIGARIALAGITLEGGFQVYDALLVEHENQPEENSANVNFNGFYFEIAARF